MNIQNLLISLMMVIVVSASAVEKPAYSSNYKGQEQRRIKSLSNDDVQQLEAGKGWGLAKAAELNGMPGPSHVLQMKDKIGLSRKQETQIQRLFAGMQAEAIPLGKRLVQLEKQLNEAFAKRKITDASLRNKLQQIADVRKELRYVHLATHLKTPAILSTQQIELYNRLRGYHHADPCSHIPEGHNADMWRRHNGCE